MEKKDKLLSCISILGVVAYPCLFMFFFNADEANIIEVFSIMFLFLVGGYAVCALLRLLVFKSINKACLLTNIIAIIVLNFAGGEYVLQKVFGSVYYWHVVYICVVLFCVLAVVIRTKFTEETALMINRILLLLFGALIVINAVVAVPTIYRRVTTKATEAAELDYTPVKQSSDQGYKPNVYLMIFDEFAGPQCIKEYCGQDNKDFWSSLESMGFTVSYTSYSYSLGTTVEVPNILNLSFVNSPSMIEANLTDAMNNPYLYRLAKEAGYKLNIVDSTSFLDATDSDYQMESSEGTGVTEFSEKYYILERTAFYPIIEKRNGDDILRVEKQFEYLEQSYNLEDDSMLTVSYMCFPHLPWFVDADGKPISAKDRRNWRDTDVYLGQYLYCSKRIIDTVQTLVENDPNAIIILASDHGYRLPLHLLGYGVDISQYSTAEQMNVMLAVYNGGDTIDIEGESVLNAVRAISDDVFNTNLGRLEGTP